MTLKLTLILVSSLPPASTECANQDGNMRSTSDASKLAPVVSAIPPAHFVVGPSYLTPLRRIR